MNTDGVPTIRLTLARFSRYERPQWLARSTAVLNAEELARVAAISDPDTRAQHALGRALVRLVGARELGCGPAEVAVAVTDAGRPWLPELPGLHVNVSHARRAVVVATASVAPVGVDIEHPSATVPQPRRLAQRLFAGEEVRDLRELSEEVMADWFASLWTIKEAVGKALGVGIIPALSEVVVGNSGAGLRLAAVGGGPPADSWTLHQLVAPGGHEKIAVAVPVPDVALEPVSVLTLAEFADAVGAHGATARTWCGSATRRTIR